MKDLNQAANLLKEAAETKLFEIEVQSRHRKFLENEMVKVRNRPIERTLKPKSQCLAEALEMRADLEEDYVKQRYYLDNKIIELRADQ